MRYLPKSPSDRKEMLSAIGVKKINDLFSSIPDEYRLKRDLAIPRQFGEQEIIEYLYLSRDLEQTSISS